MINADTGDLGIGQYLVADMHNAGSGARDDTAPNGRWWSNKVICSDTRGLSVRFCVKQSQTCLWLPFCDAFRGFISHAKYWPLCLW